MPSMTVRRNVLGQTKGLNNESKWPTLDLVRRVLGLQTPVRVYLALGPGHGDGG